MKDTIGKSKIKSTYLPRKLTINKGDLYNIREITDIFNDVKYQNHLKHLEHILMK